MSRWGWLGATQFPSQKIFKADATANAWLLLPACGKCAHVYSGVLHVDPLKGELRVVEITYCFPLAHARELFSCSDMKRSFQMWRD